MLRLTVKFSSRWYVFVASAWLLAMHVTSSVLAAAPLAVQPRVSCEQLVTTTSSESLSKAVGAPTRLTSAQEMLVESGRYCVVQGTISPEIRFEVHLPVSDWTGRYLQLGCGGLCGSLRVRVEHADRCVPVNNHQVVLASTDMGHSGQGGQWAERNPAARADFGYRGVHLTSLAARAVIASYYGRPARYSYFSGCSDGGREALIEAQRYPQDFDGIAAGAPALNFSVQNSFYHAWNALSNTGTDGLAILTAANLPALHAAVVAACDELDGNKDGIIDDPRRCHPNPLAAQCKAGAAENCLSAAQVETARKLYDSARDANGVKLVMGGPMPGSELSWAGVYVPQKSDGPIMSRNFAEDTLRYLAYENSLPSSWALTDFQFTVETLKSFKLRGLYDATNPDLSAFRKRGGKLLMWHGWSDQHISPMNSIGYYEAVSRYIGRSQTLSFARLFLLPGVYHCGAGEGPVNFDVISALFDWVEARKAPEVIWLSPDQDTGSASSKPGAKPVYPYPDLMQRVASVASGQPGAFRRVKGEWMKSPIQWAGEDLFKPGYEIKCDAGVLSQCTESEPSLNSSFMTPQR